MDGPNAPNPANPNAQNPADQNQDQDQDQVPTGQAPVPQPVPAQPAPEQLFHVWRTFKFDKNTDSVDSYVLRMSQVAAMLNYGEMQILENFKNTLPY